MFIWSSTRSNFKTKARFANQNDQLSSFHHAKHESAPKNYILPMYHAHKFAINDFFFLVGF